MSCGNPETEKDTLMFRRLKFDKSVDCVRCKTNTGNVVIRHAVYCKDCFFPLITTKFRRSLEPSINVVPDGPRRKALKAAGNLLIGFSGGLGSAVLLDLTRRCYFSEQTGIQNGNGKLRGGRDHPRNASLWPKAAVCYVETCSAFPGVKDKTDDIRTAVEKYGCFEFIPVRIEDAFDSTWWEQVGGRPIQTSISMDATNENLFLSALSDVGEDQNPIASLRAYIACLPTQTAILSAIENLVRLLLLHTAKSTNSSHLLLGTSLTSLSVALISSISQGGGFVVKEEVQEEWKFTTPLNEGQAKGHITFIRIIRPLRDIGMKECTMWAWWNDVRIPGRQKSPGGKQGIGALTKDFIYGLEQDFPSTVSTIARTCAKLVSKGDTGGTCMLCERPVQAGVQEWKARISIRSFTDSSSPLPPHLPPNADLSSHEAPPSASLTPYLCYSCHTTLTSRSSRGTTSNTEAASQKLTPLPRWVTSHLHDTATRQADVRGGTRLGNDEMRASIAEFLLPDES